MGYTKKESNFVTFCQPPPESVTYYLNDPLSFFSKLNTVQGEGQLSVIFWGLGGRRRFFRLDHILAFDDFFCLDKVDDFDFYRVLYENYGRMGSSINKVTQF
jgi:hypothetical protein